MMRCLRIALPALAGWSGVAFGFSVALVFATKSNASLPPFMQTGTGEWHACSDAPCQPPLISIPALQGDGATSSFEGVNATIREIVIGCIAAAEKDNRQAPRG